MVVGVLPFNFVVWSDGPLAGCQTLWVEWRYFHDNLGAVGIGCAKVAQFWRRHKQALVDALKEHGLQPFEHLIEEQFSALPKGEVCQFGEYVLSVQALLLLLWRLACLKQVKSTVNDAAWSTISSLLEPTLASLEGVTHDTICYNILGQAMSTWPLHLSADMWCEGLLPLAERHPEFAKAWSAQSKVHAARPLSQRVPLRELLVFLVYLQNHERTIPWWGFWGRPFCHQFLTSAMHALSECLRSSLLKVAAETAPEQEVGRLAHQATGLRLRRTGPKGRRLSVVSQLAHRRKMREVPGHAGVKRKMLGSIVHHASMKRTDIVAVTLYSNFVSTAFKDVSQISLAWDSSFHSEDSMVYAVHSWEAQLAAWLPVQVMSKVLVKDLDDEMLQIAHNSTLCRLSTFSHMKALCNALQSVGKHLDSFRVPEGVLVRPLTATEFRERDPEGFMVHDLLTGTAVRQTPAGFTWDQLPMCVNVLDQGGSGMSCVQYLIQRLGLSMLAVWDPFHRTWNDARLALRKCKAPLWKSVLEWTVVFNVAYGPFNSGSWMQTLRDTLESFHSEVDPEDSFFRGYAPLIAAELGRPEPTTREQLSDLKNDLLNIVTMQSKGVKVKLSRWFSWFDAAEQHVGGVWALKMLLEFRASSAIGLEDAPAATAAMPLGASAEAQIQEDKKKLGILRMIPALITSQSLFWLEVIKLCGRACWHAFAARAKERKNPGHNLVACIQDARGRWQIELRNLVLLGLLGSPRNPRLALQVGDFAARQEKITTVFELTAQMLKFRSGSLAATVADPPARYARSMSANIAEASADMARMKADWETLQDLELAEASCPGACAALADMRWRHAVPCRALFMAFEEGNWDVQACVAGQSLLRASLEIIPDSKLIEEAHQRIRKEQTSNLNKGISVQRRMCAVVESNIFKA